MQKIDMTYVIAGIILALTAPLAGQEGQGEEALQDYRVDESGEIKIFSDLTIPVNEIRHGNLRVIGGTLTVAGTVTGRITVLGGNVVIDSTAVIEGVLVALGGTITRHPAARVTGDILEVNLGKVSLSREKADAIFLRSDVEDQALSSRWDDDYDRADDDDYGVRRPTFRNRTRGLRSSYRSRIRNDLEVPGDLVIRYNRAEGAAFYLPLDLDTDDISGFHVDGFGGYAFGPERWYGRLAIAQYFFKHRLGLIVEGHSEARHDDGWRISPTENFIGAFFLKEDWHDYYEAEGYGGSVVVYPLAGLRLMARYRNETQRLMPRTVSWSMFGGEKNFRPGYPVTNGKDVNLAYQFQLGSGVGLFHRRFALSLTASYTSTLPGSFFEYTREEVVANLFLPLHRRIGIRAAVKTGATLSTGTGFGLQHMVPVGGVGSIGGYAYKDQAGSHYVLVDMAFTLDRGSALAAILWQYGRAWDAEYGLFQDDYFNAVSQSSRHSIGLRLGDEESRLELFRPLSGSKNEFVIYFRLMDF